MIEPGSAVWLLAERIFQQTTLRFTECVEIARRLDSNEHQIVERRIVCELLRIGQLARGVLAVLLIVLTTVTAHGQSIYAYDPKTNESLRLTNGAMLDAAQSRGYVIAFDRGYPLPQRPLAQIKRKTFGPGNYSGVAEGSGAAQASWGGGPLAIDNPFARRLTLIPYRGGKLILDEAR